MGDIELPELINWRNSLNRTKLDKTSGEEEGIAWNAAVDDVDEKFKTGFQMGPEQVNFVNF